MKLSLAVFAIVAMALIGMAGATASQVLLPQATPTDASPLVANYPGTLINSTCAGVYTVSMEGQQVLFIVTALGSNLTVEPGVGQMAPLGVGKFNLTANSTNVLVLSTSRYEQNNGTIVLHTNNDTYVGLINMHALYY